MSGRIKRMNLSILVFALLFWQSPETAKARMIDLSVAVDKPIVLRNESQVAYLRVGLTGFPMHDLQNRSPLNVAIVLDKSGSMQGEKIERAKEAAIMAIHRLDSRDIVSIIAYDETVEVVVPATKASDIEAISAAIRAIQARGNTALFAGVSKGAAEVRKFLSKNHVNRIVLLSDGVANVGLSSPSDLGALGSILADEGMSVTTIGLGLGYNEDLLSELATRSDGYHYFAEGLEDLSQMFDQEFGKALSLVAQGIEIRIRCAPGVIPRRILGKSATIDGSDVRISLNNLFSESERRIVLEVELSPEMLRDPDVEIAAIDVDYDNLLTRSRDHLDRKLSIETTLSRADVDANINSRVMVDVVKILAVEQNMQASLLRDQGRIAEALELLLRNADFLAENALRFNSQDLQAYSLQQEIDAQNLDDTNWDRQRKEMEFNAVKALY